LKKCERDRAMPVDIHKAALTALLVLSAPLMAQERDVKQRMLTRVYDQGGETLFCRETFQSGEDIKLNRIYSQKQLLDHFDCVSRGQCARRKPFRAAMSDPHNIFPVKSRAELDRRDTRFGDLPDDIKVASEACPYQRSFQTFEPPEYARGEVARAMLYMHVIHDLPLVGSLEMYQRWNREDPPDEDERVRNDAIKAMTGQGNPFIETPERADEIMPASPKRLQFGQ